MRPSETLIVAWCTRNKLLQQAEITNIKARLMFDHATHLTDLKARGEMHGQAEALHKEAGKMRKLADKEFLGAIYKEWKSRYRIYLGPDYATLWVRAPGSDEEHQLDFKKSTHPHPQRRDRPRTAVEAVAKVIPK